MIKKNIPFKIHEGYYTCDDIDKVTELALSPNMAYGNNKGEYYYNVPCAFDIETTSFYIHDNHAIDYDTVCKLQKHDKKYKPVKAAIMYVWQLGINGYVVIGRTWDEFIQVVNYLQMKLSLNPEKRRLLIYVHNLAFEFQFMRKWFDWYKVFCLDERKPVYAITTTGIEFRCSLILSGYSLANLSKQLRNYPVKKLTGDLDYRLLRHSKTPLTDAEIGYCINDVQVVMSYIYDCIQDEGSINKIPLTKTGYVRRYCKQHTLKNKKGGRNLKYTEQIKLLRINTVEEFDIIQRAFMGGFTHANAHHQGMVLHDVQSYDFTSSYPYALVSEKYPMSRSIEVKPKTLTEAKQYMKDYCCVFECAFINIRTIKTQEHYLSQSKCQNMFNDVIDNGRVVQADGLETVLTNVDFEIVEKFYKWDEVRFRKFYIYYKTYLPTELVNCIIKFYGDKTKLKGVQGKEVEYMVGKGMLNAVFGMAVTNPLRDEYIISEDGETWDVNKAIGETRQELLDKHNDSSNRFLYYLWGVFCTAYSRRNLFTAIEAVGNDYVYSDTDSIKLLNAERHKAYFEAYNREVEIKLKRACRFHKVPIDSFSPQTIKGENKPLGVWDYEGTYTSFKTLGAKRYAIESYDEMGNPNAIRIGVVNYPVSITVSGLNKMVAVPHLYELANNDTSKFMDMFSEGLKVDSEYTGKLLHTYIDDVRQGVMIDYLGNECEYLEKSAVHLEPTSYNLSLSSQYIEYLLGIRNYGY